MTWPTAEPTATPAAVVAIWAMRPGPWDGAGGAATAEGGGCAGGVGCAGAAGLKTQNNIGDLIHARGLKQLE